MLKQAKILGVDAKVGVPVVALLNPVLVPSFIGSWLNEELHLHLFKLACSKHKVSWGDLISKALTDLTNTKRGLHSSRVKYICKVHENSLSGFRTQVMHSRFVFDRT